MSRYPALHEVEAADTVQLARWLRFLPSPGESAAGTPAFDTAFRQESEVMVVIVRRFSQAGGWTPDLSKAIGWG